MDEQPKNHRVLVIDDDEGVRNFIARGLARAGFSTVAADGGASGIDRLSHGHFDAVVCDLNMPERDGLDVLKFAASLDPKPAFIVLTGFGSISVAVEAMKRGASDFIEKPVAIDALKAAIVSVLTRSREGTKATPHAAERPRLVGDAAWLGPFLASLRRIAQRDVTVLIEGETGTGKSAVAREIWRSSSRKDGPFVELNCAAIPENLLESELFGHKKGSFSGAISDYVGHVEQANGGTLFLDEIGELKQELQAKLLHLLQEKTFSPIGSAQKVHADVRFLAATNRRLEAEVDAGRFRSDLYYRLNVVGVTIPPLRERPSDVPILVEHFRAALASRQPDEAPPSFSSEALEVMAAYSWRGNTRELANLVERMAVVHPPGTLILPEHLPPRMLEEARGRRDAGSERADSGLTVPVAASGPHASAPAPASPSPTTAPEAELSLTEAMQNYEKRRIVEALESAEGNKSQAARLLGIRRTTLLEKMKRLGIQSSSED